MMSDASDTDQSKLRFSNKLLVQLRASLIVLDAAELDLNIRLCWWLMPSLMMLVSYDTF